MSELSVCKVVDLQLVLLLESLKLVLVLFGAMLLLVESLDLLYFLVDVFRNMIDTEVARLLYKFVLLLQCLHLLLEPSNLPLLVSTRILFCSNHLFWPLSLG